MTDETVATAPKRRGRPPRMAQPERTDQRAPQRNSTLRQTRTGRIQFSDNVYDFDRSLLNPDMDYQWVTKAVLGKDDGRVRADFAKFQMNGWQPVDGSLLPQFGIASGAIEIGGLVLMQRPIEMSEEAREEDRMAARKQVAGQINSLEDTGPGHLPRDNRGESLVSIKRGEPIQVRGDDIEYERP